MKKKVISLLLASAMLTGLLGGCGSGNENKSGDGDSNSAEPKTLSVMCHASWANSEGELAQIAYVEEALNVKLEFEKVPDGTEGEQIIQTRYASGEVPDILFWSPANYVKPKMDLSNFVDVSGDWQQYYDEAAIATPSFTVDGTVYGAPWGDATLFGMCYNKQVFADNGLEIPTTWDEFYDICDQLKGTDVTPIYYSGADAWTLQIMPIDSFGYVAYGKDFDETVNLIDTNQLKWADMTMVQDMLDVEKDLVDQGYVQETYLSDTYQDAVTALIDGSAAMYPHATWIAPVIMESDPSALENIGFFPIPTEDGSRIVTMGSPNAMYVSAKGENVELAKEVVNCLASKEALTAKYQAMEGVPFINGLEGIELSGINEDAMNLMAEEGVCVSNAMDFTKYTKGPLETYVQEMLVGDKTSADVLAALDADFEKQAKDAGDENWK